VKQHLCCRTIAPRSRAGKNVRVENDPH
jgi:hypothetical protein